MFDPIIPKHLDGDNRHRAELLAAGLNSGALPAEQAAVALMLRMPYGVGLRDDVWARYVVTDGAIAVYAWTDLANDAVSGDVPLSRGERLLVRAAAAIANPMCSTPLHQLAGSLDPACYDLLLAALYHAAGRPNPADQLAERDAEIAELRRRIDAYAVAEAATADKLTALRDQLAAAVEPVRGTEDGAGEPLPDGVEGHQVNGRGALEEDPAYAEQMRVEAEHVQVHAATGGDCCDDRAPNCPPIATVPRSDEAGIGWRCIACGVAWSGDRAHPQSAPASVEHTVGGIQL